MVIPEDKPLDTDNPRRIVLHNNSAVDGPVIQHLASEMEAVADREEVATSQIEAAYEYETSFELSDNAHPAVIFAKVAGITDPEYHSRVLTLIENVQQQNVSMQTYELQTERLEITEEFRDKRFARIAALIFALTLVGVSTYLIMHNKEVAGLVGICATIAAIVGTFITGKLTDAKPDPVVTNSSNSNSDKEPPAST